MPRPRIPDNMIHLSPGMLKNPKRKAARVGGPIPTAEIGEPPDDLDKYVAECFRQIVSECPPGVLKNSDRAAVRSAARLMNKENNGSATSTEIGLLKQYYQQFGMTPASRSLVNVPQAENGNEFASA